VLIFIFYIFFKKISPNCVIEKNWGYFLSSNLAKLVEFTLAIYNFCLYFCQENDEILTGKKKPLVAYLL